MSSISIFTISLHDALPILTPAASNRPAGVTDDSPGAADPSLKGPARLVCSPAGGDIDECGAANLDDLGCVPVYGPRHRRRGGETRPQAAAGGPLCKEAPGAGR